MSETPEQEYRQLLDDNVQIFYNLAKKIRTDEAIPEEERFKQACEAYENTLKIADEVSYDDEKLLDIILDYADYLEKSKDHAYAECKYRDAIVICDRLAANDPEKFDKEVASILNKRASVLHADKRYDEADADYCEARVRYDALNEKHPGQFDYCIGDILFCLAKLHEDMERFESAENEYKDSAEILRRLASEHPDAQEQIKIIEERLKVLEKSHVKAEATKAPKPTRSPKPPKSTPPPPTPPRPREETTEGCFNKPFLVLILVFLLALLALFSCRHTSKHTSIIKSDPEEDLRIGIEYYNKKEYNMALSYFIFASDGNNSEAMYYVGLMSENGQGTMQSYSMAKKWYAKSANLGNTKAARKLDELIRKTEPQPQSRARNRNTSNNSKPFKDFHTLLDK